MNWVLDKNQWAHHVFGDCELGDVRRTKRLVDYAQRQADSGNQSPLASCQGNQAAAEGAYRLFRNEKVDPQAIAEGGFKATIQEAQHRELMLAIEDTTTLSYPHAVKDELGDLGGRTNSKRRGMFVHSVLLFDAIKHQTIGLIEQERWIRKGPRGRRHSRKERAYEDKESFKWQRASQHVANRLGNTMSQVISVCDREADVFEYLQYKIDNKQRFIVRASWNRALDSSIKHLWEKLSSSPVQGHRVVDLPQYGGPKGRRARSAKLSLRFEKITLRCPRRAKGKLPSLDITAIHAIEPRPPKGEEALEWMLLTTEPVENQGDVERILDFYAKRWIIEEFHKAWKTGAGVEERRMQAPENIERIAIILAFIAVRIFQLRELMGQKPDQPCTAVLEPVEWKCLWTSIEKKRVPKKIPSAGWAYYAIAKLGGWIDTKRTKKVGWLTLWKGWWRLEDRVEAIKLMTKFQT